MKYRRGNDVFFNLSCNDPFYRESMASRHVSLRVTSGTRAIDLLTIHVRKGKKRAETNLDTMPCSYIMPSASVSVSIFFFAGQSLLSLVT